MEKIFAKDYPVGPGETDLFAMCRPSALLGFLQDAATIHATLLGLSREDLIRRHGAVWILSRIRYELTRPLKFAETITVHTWPSTAKGALIRRDFDILADGRPAGEAFSAWVVLDLSARRPLRPGVVYNAFDGVPLEKCKNRELLKIHPEGSPQPAGDRTVRYSDLDINGHLNNVRYADVICDALEFDKLSGRYISEMQINFTAECRPGDIIALDRAHSGEKAFITGSCGGARRFESEIFLEGC